MRAVGEADRGRGARDLLHRHAMLEIAEPEAAVFLRRGDSMQPERAHLGPEIARKLIVAVDRGGARRDLALGEFARGFADHVGASPRSKLRAAGRLGIIERSSARGTALVGDPPSLLFYGAH